MRLRTPWLPIIMFALAGCGNEAEIPEAPQLFTDRDAMLFNTEFGSGTYIGQTTFNSLTLENRGQESLVITEITLAGPRVFTLTLPEGFAADTPLTLETYDRAFLQVAFRPTDDVSYQGSLSIKSNAGNTPLKQVELHAEGVNP